jgi:hypothetical protein
MTIQRIAIRAAELTGSYGVTGYKPELVDAMAIATARATLANQELALFTHYCYVKVGERFVNLYGNCYVRQWTPWSRKGKLTRAEGDTVRRYLLSLRRPSPLYRYSERNKRWWVDTVKYKTLEWALEWCESFAITPEKWVEYWVEGGR